MPPPPDGISQTVGHAAARQVELPILLDALGTVTPLATVTLKPQVGGVLTEVLFTEGQTVAKGQLLARIDPRPYEQALAQANGARVRDEAQLEAARVTLERYRTLLGQDSIARQDVDTQAALVRQLEGAVISDRAAEASARLNLDFTRITAPVAGRIGLRSVDPQLVELARSVGASRIETLVHLRLPASLPSLFSAARIGVGMALIGSVLGEYFAGATGGLGYLIKVAQSRGVNFSYQQWGAIFVLAFLGSAIVVALSLVERVVLHWHSSQRDRELVA
jgi:multidrug efflux pump subunit AcrA (membrane-fusion protein)